MTSPAAVLLPWRGPRSVASAMMRCLAIWHPELVEVDVVLQATPKGLLIVPVGSSGAAKETLPLVVEERNGGKP